MIDDGLSVIPDEPVARHVPLRTGGRCGAWVVAHDLDGLTLAISECRAASWRVTVMGAGTRTLVRDGPLDGVVLRLGTGFSWIRPGETWEVGAAYPVPALVAAAAAAGASGLEGHACTAGSVGAAVLHDDGWDDLVTAVSALKRGRAAEVTLDEARKRRPIVLSVSLRLAISDPAAVRRRTDAALAKGAPVPPGSWYEPVKRHSLRELLGSVRLPMVRLRQVAIPSGAPELLVNLGGGTATDLALLHRSAVERVKKVRGIELSARLKWVGIASE